MNFLLHHHLARRDLGRAAAGSGAMLPDVWRMADRRARLREGQRREETGTARAILEGIAHHVAADARFHATPVFEGGERSVREALRRASRAPKLGLFAHMAWEMCLDGALVRREGLASLLDAVRESIDTVRPDAHHGVARSRAPAVPVEDRARFEARVDRILDAIALGPWVAGYATGEGIVERLDGLRGRLGFTPLPAADRGALAPELDALSGRADDALGEILAW